MISPARWPSATTRSGRLPGFLQVVRREPAHAGTGVIDHGAERLVDFVRDRGRQLAHRRQPRHVRQLRLGMAQRLLGLLAFGHIHHGPHEFNRSTGGVEHRMAYGVDVSHRAVGKHDAALQFVVRALTDGALEDVGGPGVIVWMNPLAKCCE